jgi:hypothetical protein
MKYEPLLHSVIITVAAADDDDDDNDDDDDDYSIINQFLTLLRH